MFKNLRLLALFLCVCVASQILPAVAQGSQWFDIRPNISDEDFFGVWDGGEWSNPGRLNYGYSQDMAPVRDFVRQNDYAGAKRALLEYYRHKQWNWVSTINQNALMANLAAENVFPFDTTVINSFTMPLNTGWTEYSIDVTSFVNTAAGRSNVAFVLVPLRKDVGDVAFKSREADGGLFAPRIDLVASERYMSLTAKRDGYIANADVNASFTGGGELLARESGFPVDAHSKRPYIGFEFGGIEAGTVTQAVLRVWGRNDGISRHSETEIYLYSDPAPNWKEDSESGFTPDDKLTWKAHAGSIVFSWEGCAPDQLVWENGSYTTNAEYGFGVLSRFPFLQHMASQYLRTKDEYYAQNAIRLLLSRYYQKGTAKSGPGAEVGGWPRALDAAVGLSAIARMLPNFISSPSMQPEYFTEILKGMWLTAKFLRAEGHVHIVAERPELGGDTTQFLDAGYHPDGNWATNETMPLLQTTILYPEFQASGEWRETCIKRFIDFYETYLLKDGTYIESATLYMAGVLSTLNNVLLLCPDDEKIKQSKDRIIELLNGFAWGFRVMRDSDDMPVLWGDSDLYGSEKNNSNSDGLRAATLTGDQGLIYIMTNGKQGEKPVMKPLPDEAMAELEAKGKVPVGYPAQNPDVEFTSLLHPFRMTLAQRSGWLDGDAYLFCELDGGGGHSHPDDLSVNVSAYGRQLLVDSGRFNYAGGDKISAFIRRTTKAHNTVSVNNIPQDASTANSPTNAIRENNTIWYFTTNNMFDFFEGTTSANLSNFKTPSGWGRGDHTRSVAFVKPAYWIVTDKMSPADKTVVNTYEQNWHASVDFKLLTGDNRPGGVTDHSEGSNIQVVGVYDPQIEACLETGYYAPSSSFSAEVKYLALRQSKAGTVWYNTVLYPVRETDLTQVATEPLTTLYPGSSCAFKIHFDNEKSRTEDVYFISIAENGFVRPTDEFDRYRFDGKSAHIQKNALYETAVVSIVDGRQLFDDGVEIIGSDAQMTDFSVEWASTDGRYAVAIEMSTSMDLSKLGAPVRVYAPEANDYKWITLNGKDAAYTRQGDYIVLGARE